MPHKKWASWIVAGVLFIVVATRYTIDFSSITDSHFSNLNNVDYPSLAEVQSQSKPGGPISEPDSQPSSVSESLACPEPETCPTCVVPEDKAYLDLPAEYTSLSDEDRLCEEFYTEKYIQTIATSSKSMCDAGSAVTQFEVPTHPSHRKLNKATPVWLMQGVHWDPAVRAFITASNDKAELPSVFGMFPLSELKYDPTATGCLSSSKRQLIVYPALWEGTFPNIWHRLLEIWQAKLSFDAMSIALNPDTGAPYLTREQIAAANVVLPADAPGPWGDLWKIVTPTTEPALSPSTLDPETCYDVIIPTVGYASPFWSALLTSTYESCPRQTLMNTFVARIMEHYGVTPRPAAAIAVRPQPPTITVIQRGSSRKFLDFEALLEKMHARHPDSAINVVDLALLSTKEQINLAHNTDVWVAHHGAGMTYAMFMSRTAAVVEILPPIFVSRGFRWISRMRGLVHFVGRAMWKADFEEKYEGKPKPLGWTPGRQDDSDADQWQTEEWVWMRHEDILDLVDAAVASQRERVNDIPQ
ncbi:unnamed protein product [Discula destructiva]